MRRAAGGASGVIGVNVGANRDAADRIADYALGVKTFAPLADYLAINMSSPNTPGLRDLQRRDALDELIAAGRRRARRNRAPPPAAHQDRAGSRRAAGSTTSSPWRSRDGIDGLIISNTTVARPASLSSRHRAETGGLSGRPLFEPSTRLLARAYLAHGGAMPLIGCGGVEDAATALAKIEAGANLVQLYTSLALKGAGVVEEILDGLSARSRSAAWRGSANWSAPAPAPGPGRRRRAQMRTSIRRFNPETYRVVGGLGVPTPLDGAAAVAGGQPMVMVAISVCRYAVIACLFAAPFFAAGYQRLRRSIDRVAGACLVVFGARFAIEP